ncbi:MAG: hypothetical protein LBQ20_11805 [Rhodanobacter sp.]|jgi:hypothetical protein|nr:hypothetical protein [Rhodanobacter sp.]
MTSVTTDHLADMIASYGGTVDREGEVITSFTTPRGKQITWRCPQNNSRAEILASAAIQIAVESDRQIQVIDANGSDQTVRAAAIKNAYSRLRSVHETAQELFKKMAGSASYATRNTWLQGVISQAGRVVDGLKDRK